MAGSKNYLDCPIYTYSKDHLKTNLYLHLLYFTLLWHGHGGSSAFRRLYLPLDYSQLIVPRKIIDSLREPVNLAPPRTQLVNVPDFGTSPWVWAKSGVRGWNVQDCAFSVKLQRNFDQCDQQGCHIPEKEKSPSLYEDHEIRKEPLCPQLRCVVHQNIPG